MTYALVFVNGKQTSILQERDSIVREINHFKAFWLSGIGAEYTNDEKTVVIKIHGMTNDDRKYFSSRMRG